MLCIGHRGSCPYTLHSCRMDANNWSSWETPRYLWIFLTCLQGFQTLDSLNILLGPPSIGSLSYYFSVIARRASIYHNWRSWETPTYLFDPLNFPPNLSDSQFSNIMLGPPSIGSGSYLFSYNGKESQFVRLVAMVHPWFTFPAFSWWARLVIMQIYSYSSFPCVTKLTLLVDLMTKNMI